MSARDLIVESVKVSDIFIVGERRPVCDDTVKRLADSIERIGLQHPITIRFVDYLNDPVEGELHGAYVLVAGRHRLDAIKSLGRSHIDAIVVEWNETEARLWEIAENLHRAELTALERDEQIAEWVRLTAEKVAQSAPPRGGAQPKDEGVRKAARDLGIERTDVQRAVKVNSLSPEAKETARVLNLHDNRSALLSAAKEADPAAQVAALKHRAERPKPVKIAREPLNDFEVVQTQVDRLMAAWNAASAEAREQFLARIDRPLMDKRWGAAS